MAKKNLGEMSFLDHLEELRWLLIRSTIAILACSVVAFFFSDFVFDQILFGPKNPDFFSRALRAIRGPRPIFLPGGRILI